MTVDEVQKKIDGINYWDCQVLDFTIRYFGDEIEMVVQGENEICHSIKFLLCYRVDYETDVKNRWGMMEVKDMDKKQLGYYVHDIKVKESALKDFIEVYILLDLLRVKIICKQIEFSQFLYETANFFWH